ncbi:hypothetical protein HELRODRAFT_168058 [Helobdella robusta]|uniref:Uncharacterized protein n=1 Tax=Helobdella robusta TaxID=6412 RepID=T1F046_HELRO|nr:hypothetical protein HELRODRAFT_168058 [Helobdella robusta]ESO10186.1 hypothetical protein HELRODRAFT_168058 [Helobdella robusta]
MELSARRKQNNVPYPSMAADNHTGISDNNHNSHNGNHNNNISMTENSCLVHPQHAYCSALDRTCHVKVSNECNKASLLQNKSQPLCNKIDLKEETYWLSKCDHSDCSLYCDCLIEDIPKTSSSSCWPSIIADSNFYNSPNNSNDNERVLSNPTSTFKSINNQKTDSSTHSKSPHQKYLSCQQQMLQQFYNVRQMTQTSNLLNEPCLFHVNPASCSAAETSHRSPSTLLPSDAHLINRATPNVPTTNQNAATSTFLPTKNLRTTNSNNKFQIVSK